MQNGAIGAFLNIGGPKTLDGIKHIPAGQIAGGFGTDGISLADVTGEGYSTNEA